MLKLGEVSFRIWWAFKLLNLDELGEWKSTLFPILVFRRPAFFRTSFPDILLLRYDSRDKIIGFVLPPDGKRPSAWVSSTQVTIVLHGIFLRPRPDKFSQESLIRTREISGLPHDFVTKTIGPGSSPFLPDYGLVQLDSPSTAQQFGVMQGMVSHHMKGLSGVQPLVHRRHFPIIELTI